MDLSFGEQIKIILKRKNMTIQDLANLYEEATGQKMTRQNLSQRLKRDNFPEQDMRLLANLLGYHAFVQLTPMSGNADAVTYVQPAVDMHIHPVVPKQFMTKPATQTVTTADGSKMQVPTLHVKEPVLGDVNPLTGQEYLTNTVRKHPDKDNYLQVYDRSGHEWVDVNADDFWEFQTRKKQLLGSEYQEPILI